MANELFQWTLPQRGETGRLRTSCVDGIRDSVLKKRLLKRMRRTEKAEK